MRNSQRTARFLATALLLIALLFLGASTGLAQERPVDLYPTSPISIQTGFESGVPDGNRRLNEPSTILTLPMFSLMHTSPRNDFTLSYQPEFEMFTSLHRLDSFNQNAGLQWIANISPRWTFSA